MDNLSYAITEEIVKKIQNSNGNELISIDLNKILHLDIELHNVCGEQWLNITLADANYDDYDDYIIVEEIETNSLENDDILQQIDYLLDNNADIITYDILDNFGC